MRRVRFWEVNSEDVNADGGNIEVADDGTVTMTGCLSYIADLRAPVDPHNMASTSSRPTGGFEKVGEEDGRVIFTAVGTWDPALWIDKVRYHFRTPYLRPGEIEFDAEPGQVGVAGRSSGRLDLHVDVDQPNDDWVDPVDYWWATGEGWEDIPSNEQAKLRELFGVKGDPAGQVRKEPEVETE